MDRAGAALASLGALDADVGRIADAINFLTSSASTRP